jgi:hypothetical protein
MKWEECDHVWSETDSQYTNEYSTDVICEKCKCPGEKDNVTGEVFWPAT